jgi:hypothetical protein
MNDHKDAVDYFCDVVFGVAFVALVITALTGRLG